MIKNSAEFVSLRNSEIPDEYNRAATEEAPLDVWMDLIENYHDMKVWVARNKSIPKEIIDILSRDINPIVRDAISSKYPLDFDIYLLLSKDPDDGIRVRLTYNKKLPTSILKEMAENDPSEFVRNEARLRYEQRIK
ncbi:hypothetical protein JAF85_004837 [Citrobacter werkmanii]|uniref:hypothetical protein n=1 Tax=Citrobacter TaxID=544 RepID=UPI00076EFD63|nr:MULTISPECIES: hypothetical protein [Citrobacter]GAS74958.1 hypothetical protein NGUA40_04606 [Salmonella enterica]EGT0638487.1 hypothetical protein [Citrobacter werkmanii]EGT0674016.1 hypothetical protein [Citrobacter werkmanii]MDT0638162.1 hypothetical protein [Citrobacter werkmanii]TKU70787.1 hypothetical protein FDX14_18260 [Citrobacter sp. wls710]